LPFVHTKEFKNYDKKHSNAKKFIMTLMYTGMWVTGGTQQSTK